MNLPASAFSEFKWIFESEFNRTLTDDEARERAEAFMRVVILILRPVPSERRAMKFTLQEVDGLPAFDRLVNNPLGISNVQT